MMRDLKARLLILFAVAVLLIALVLFVSNRHDDDDDGVHLLPADHAGSLVIYSTTDSAAFRPVIADFRSMYPRIGVEYVELDAGALHRLYLEESAAKRPKADFLLSSAMDLQVKLVNDGFATTHASADVAGWPSWAKWRNEAFGITFEPAAMVFNTTLLREHPIPKSRPELLEALKASPAFWRGRVGTYDIERSSVGYLLAAEDARQNSDSGSLLEVLGAAQLRTYDTTAGLLDALERGEIALGFNLLGSYASARIEAGARLSVVYPQDYTLAVSRTALIPRDAPHGLEAHAFLDYLLSLRGQKVLAAESRLSAIHPGIAGPYSQLGIAEESVGPLRPIALGPGLLTYQDREKRRRIVASWRRALSIAPPPQDNRTR
jgi:iron(III) transport system substrate-binding protein